MLELASVVSTNAVLKVIYNIYRDVIAVLYVLNRYRAANNLSLTTIISNLAGIAINIVLAIAVLRSVACPE